MNEARGNFIGGEWRGGTGAEFLRHDPTTGLLIWKAASASAADAALAVAAAMEAGSGWRRMAVETRAEFLERFAEVVKNRGALLREAICRETGKPRWESETEVDAIARKIGLTRRALAERRGLGEGGGGREAGGTPAVQGAAWKAGGKPAVHGGTGAAQETRYRPVGVMAVLGPFNLPAHLPNGQIAPALLAGNTVVFKPSEQTPGVGEIYAACWEEAGLPAGVFNLVQGGRETGAALVAAAGVDGVLFTGSYAGGVALSRGLAEHPEKMLALEMGGNNPLVAAAVGNMDAAAYMVVQSAFITAGQRCTCARRLIVLDDVEGQRLVERVVEMAGKVRVGSYAESPEPFMGPVISEAAGQRVLDSQRELEEQGGVVLRRMNSVGTRVNMLSPGIMDVTGIANRNDEEIFGPFLQVVRVKDFAAAIAEANRTRFGLAAGLLSADAGLWERFAAEAKAGIVNWNRPTTGAAGDLPFGGVGASGNHRPAGFFAVDFCNDPVAILQSPRLALPEKLSPGIEL